MDFNLTSSFIISVASGKGGAGKTMTSVNIAESLALQGHRVALIDADLGLSNCATLLNTEVPASALDVLHERSYLQDILHTTSSGLTLVTGADDPDPHIRDWSPVYAVLDEAIRELRADHDFILIDTPAGASDLSLWALDRSDLCLLLLANEPTVISDVYRFCKFIMEIDPVYPFATIVNFAEDEQEARNTSERFNSILKHFMKRELPFLGYIPNSEKIRASINRQIPITRENPDSAEAAEFSYIAQTLQSISTDKHDMYSTTEHISA